MSTTIDTLATAVQEAARAKVAAYEACQKTGGDGTYWAPAAERAALDAADLKLTAAVNDYAKAHADTTTAYWTTFEERDRAGREAARVLTKGVAAWL